MKVYEFLSFHTDFMKMLQKFGIDINDCKWVELYHEYKKLKEKEHKMVYIVAFLSDLGMTRPRLPWVFSARRTQA